MSEKLPDLSVVIPVFNEERSLPILYQRLTNSLKKLEREYEIIFIDDGSTDGGYSTLGEIGRNDGRVKVIRLPRNTGKSNAYSRGFRDASGEVIVTMDADLQDAPEDIGRFLDKIAEGYDLVVGWKHINKGPLLRTVSSRLFNALVAVLSGLKLHDINCPFKAYRRQVIRNIRIYGELYRFIPLIAREKGYRIAEVKIGNYPRLFGKSKYGPTRFVKGLLDLLTVIFITRYSQRPLHVFGSLGLLSFISGFAIDAYLAVKGLIVGRIGHSAMLLFGVLLMILGVQLISMGVVAEFIVNLRKEEEPGGLR